MHLLPSLLIGGGLLLLNASCGPAADWTQTSDDVPEATLLAEVQASAICVGGVTASGHDGNAPENAVDGNVATRWSAHGEGAWIRYDFGSEREVTAADIAWYRGNERRANFSIELSSDGNTWRSVHQGQSSGTSLGAERYPLDGSSARYVRLVGHGNTKNMWTSLTEMKFHSSTRVPVSAVTASKHDGNVPQNTIDGDPATRWSAYGEGVWLSLDPGQEVTLSGLEIAWYRGDARVASFSIDVSSDGLTWQRIHSGQSSGKTLQPEPVALAPVAARYVRVIGHGNSSNLWTSMTHVALRGVPATTSVTATPICNGGSLTPISAEMRSSVSQYGITWTFDQPYPVGQFVTGDWWVVGPVEIVSVSPAPAAGRNGSMLNPLGAQAYDSRGGSYASAKGVSFPLSVSGRNSLVSSISHPEQSECVQGGASGWRTYDGGCQRGPIHTQAILTILDAVPGAATFRPPYAGTQKPLHDESSICWSRLPKLPPPAETATGESMLRHVRRPWIDHLNSWQMQKGCATHNMYCYGREVGNIVSKVATHVLLDTPEQQELARHFVQLGIDNYGVLAAGGGWKSDGGHFNGRKWPIMFAGLMLGDPDMQRPGTINLGNEDVMTYYGANGKALWGRPCSKACYFLNSCSYSGTCTSGSKDCRDPAYLVDGCSSYRNCCTSVTWVGTALAAQVLGARSDWGNDAFFDYVDRWMTGDVSGGGGASNSFVKTMWTTYRYAPPHTGACP